MVLKYYMVSLNIPLIFSSCITGEVRESEKSIKASDLAEYVKNLTPHSFLSWWFNYSCQVLEHKF